MKKMINLRIFTGLALAVSLLMLLISGTLLWIFPVFGTSGASGGIAGIQRKVWMGQHIIFGILFTALSLYHLFYLNREPFFSYFRKKGASVNSRRSELITTLGVVLCITMVTWQGGLSLSVFQGPFHAGPLLPSRPLPDQPVSPDDRMAWLETEGIWRQNGEERHFGHNAPKTAWRRSETDISANSDRDRGDWRAQAPDDELHRNAKTGCASCH